MQDIICAERDSNKVCLEMLEYVTVNSERYAWDCYTLLCMSGLSLSDWRAKMAFWANPADTMVIYALSDQYGLHTSVITKWKLWTTVTSDFQGTEWDVLEISAIKLLYMGANRFGPIWKKAVPDQPSFYSPNFNYQPMLPNSSVPSTDDVETACTLVQIGDNVTPYMHDTAVPDTRLFEGPEVSISDDSMDKIVGRLDVCMWKPFNCIDAMDQIVTSSNSVCINVETKTATKPQVIVNVETKRCMVKLVRLDSILFDNTSDKSVCESEEDSANLNKMLQKPPDLPRLRPKNRSNRTTRCPRNASQNMQYTEETEPVPPAKNQTGYVKNIKPSASGPSDECVRAQSKWSEQPSSSLPGLPIPEVDPYDGETELESDVPMETPSKATANTSTLSPKKGTISIMNHTLKKKSTPRKYRCKTCGDVLDSVHELTTHHQTNHNILYCSTCNRAFNNPLSLSRHEYEHKHKDLKCPKCDHTFTFESQVKAHMFSHQSNPSFFCVHSNCGKAFFNESDLTRHSKRHNSKWYQCLDCPYRDTDKRNFDSHRLSHSRIAKYKFEACGKEFVFNTQKRRHIKDSKCPIKHSG